jgi:hypothetical protein
MRSHVEFDEYSLFIEEFNEYSMNDNKDPKDWLIFSLLNLLLLIISNQKFQYNLL